jgi:hypothetical protein
MAYVFLQSEGSLSADWWVALVTCQYGTPTTTRLPLTFFKSADLAAFNRFQQPTRYSKTVWSVGILDRKRRYSSSKLHGVRGSGMGARSEILLCMQWIQLEACDHHRFQIIGNQSKVACVNDAQLGYGAIYRRVQGIPSAESLSTADFSHTYSNSFFIASAGYPPKASQYHEASDPRAEGQNAHLE